MVETFTLISYYSLLLTAVNVDLSAVNFYSFRSSANDMQNFLHIC